MFVYARAKNTTASTGTGRREASVRILGKKGILPMRIMIWTVENENTRKKIPRTKLIMMNSNILQSKIMNKIMDMLMKLPLDIRLLHE